MCFLLQQDITRTNHMNTLSVSWNNSPLGSTYLVIYMNLIAKLPMKVLLRKAFETIYCKPNL